jgi:hypothetical protein
MSYKKVRTVFINDKKKVIYMKPKGTREYVKSKGEMVLLTSYLKKVEKVAAKKAMASKLAKKSPKVARSKKYVRRGGFFFAEEDKEAPKKEGSMSIVYPQNVGMGGTGPQMSTPQMPNSQQGMSVPQMSHSQQGMSAPQMSHSQQGMSAPQMSHSQQGMTQAGGFYNEYDKAKLLDNAKDVVGKLLGDLQLTGGKKAKKGKKVMKKETNPFKNFMNTLASKKRQRKGKKRGGGEDDGDLAEVY